MIHEPMTYAEYHNMPGVRSSSLIHILDSPAMYNFKLLNPKPPTDALVLGSAVHTSVLEPDRFPLDFVVWTGGDRRSKVAKARWAAFQFEAEESGQTIVTQAQYDIALRVRDAVYANPEAAEIIAVSTHENTHTWTDPETGLLCKCRTDIELPDGSLVDLKTGRNIGQRLFGMAAEDYAYWMRMAMYVVGLTETRPVPKVSIIAALNCAPFMGYVTVYKLRAEQLAYGEQQFYECLRRVKECQQSGIWPGPVFDDYLERPAYAMPDEDPVDFSGIE